MEYNLFINNDNRRTTKCIRKHKMKGGILWQNYL